MFTKLLLRCLRPDYRFEISRQKCRQEQRGRTFRPGLELLENREVPAIYIAPGDVTGLIQAIDQANSTPSTPTVIDLAPGSTYLLVAPDNNSYGPNGLPAIASNITINGNINPDGSTSTEGAVIERAANAVPFRIFYVEGAELGPGSGQLSLNDLTIEGGLAQGGAGGDGGSGGGGGAGLGGGILNQGTLNLNGVTLTENVAQGGRGGSRSDNPDAGGGGGGALEGNGGAGWPGGIAGSGAGSGGSGGSFGGEGGFGGGGGGADGTLGAGGGNAGFGGGGGGGYDGAAGDEGYGSSGGGSGDFGAGGGGAGMGGGIFNMFGAVSVTNSTLAVNTAQGGNGGSGYIGGGNTSSGGTAGSGYGGIGQGGGIFNFNGRMNLTNDTLAGNRVATGNGNPYSAGAGVSDADDVYSVAITVYGFNTLPATATVTLTNDILSGTDGFSDLASDSLEGPDQAFLNFSGPCLMQLGTLSGGTVNVNGGLVTGSSFLLPDADPQLGPLQDNGGPTPTMEVLEGSPLFTAADLGVQPTSTNGVPSTDQRGVPRENINVLGAYQATDATQFGFTGIPPLVTAGTPQTFEVNAEDPFGNTVYTYNGTISFDATGLAVLPPSLAVVDGSGTAPSVAIIGSSGVQALIATDGNISGTSGLFVVTRMSPAQLTTILQAGLEQDIQGGYTTLDVQADPLQPYTLGSLWNGINSLPAQNAPITVNINLEGGTYPVQTVAPPSNLTVNLSAGTIIGAAPSLTVDASQGQVNLIHVTLVDTADSPTLAILGGDVTLTNDTVDGYTPPATLESDNYPTSSVVLVSGGSLVMRGDTVQSWSSAPAISIKGGTADLGDSLTPSDPGFGGNTFNGPRVLISNTSTSNVDALGNTFEHDGTKLTTSASIGTYIADGRTKSGDGLVIYTGIPTQTTLTSSTHLAHLMVVGSLVTLTATVRSQVAAAGQPTGTVTFYQMPKVGSKVMLGTGMLNGNGVATWNGQLKVKGSGLVATYLAAGVFAGSSGLRNVSVAPASTATALVSSLNPASAGQSVTFTATITVTGSGSGAPQGTVSFFDGKTLLGSEAVQTVNGQQQASYSTSTLSVRTHSITATYSDTTDSNFDSSASSALSQVVNAAPQVTTFVSGLDFPQGLAFDNDGNLYVAIGNGAVMKVTPAGVVSTFVTGLDLPEGLAFDNDANLYVATENGEVAKVTPAGMVSTFATGLGSPRGLAFDSAGNLYVASQDGTISKVTPAGVVNTFASGFNDPTALAFDKSGNLYVADSLNDTVDKVTPEGGVSIFASGFDDPSGLAFDSAGNLYVSDHLETVSEVTPAGVVSTFVSGFDLPLYLAFDAGDLFVGDFSAGTVSKVIP